MAVILTETQAKIVMKVGQEFYDYMKSTPNANPSDIFSKLRDQLMLEGGFNGNEATAVVNMGIDWASTTHEKKRVYSDDDMDYYAKLAFRL